MRSLLILSLFVAAPALAGPPEPLLVLDLRPQDVDPMVAQTITGMVTVMASKYPGVRVLSGADLQEMARLEADRQATGCDDASCLAEIAGALGARKIVTGTVGRLGRLLVVNLSLFDTQEATALQRATAQAPGLEEIPAALRPALDELFRGEAPDRTVPWVVAGSGGAVAALGLVTGLVAVIPLVGYQSGRSQLTADGADFERSPTEGGVIRLADQHAQVESDKALWNEVGAPAFIIGAGLVALGAIVAGGGAAWATVGQE